MTGSDEDHGRVQVRDVLVEGLRTAGVKPAPKMTEAAHVEWCDKLVRRLAYMTRANLEVLADTCLTHAATHGQRWPAPVVVIGWAEALQPRPAVMAPIVASWLASVEGPRAEAGGYLVQLYRRLRAHPVPVMAYDLTRLREEAERDVRQLVLTRDRMAREVASDADRRWLEAYRRDEAEAMALVEAGNARRAAKIAAKIAAAVEDQANGEAA